MNIRFPIFRLDVHGIFMMKFLVSLDKCYRSCAEFIFLMFALCILVGLGILFIVFPSLDPEGYEDDYYR